MEPAYEELKARLAELEAQAKCDKRPPTNHAPLNHPSSPRPLGTVPAFQKRPNRVQLEAQSKITIRIIGAILTIIGIYALGQPGSSVLILGVLVGPFLLLFSETFR